MSTRVRRGFLLLLMALLPTHIGAQPAIAINSGKQTKTRSIESMVPMRDGVNLSTLITLPEGVGPWPAILTRTPYGKETPAIPGLSVDFVKLGYAYVIQDSRGRFESEGEFGDFAHEKTDGVDTIEWISEQPWCSGRVGTFGISAGGILSNLATMGRPKNLVCSYVVVAHGCDFRFGTFSGGVFIKDLNERWYKGLGEPLREQSKPRLGVYDSLAADMDMKNHYGDVDIPTFNVCGWYDCFAESGVENFEGLQSNGVGQARGNQKLTVGAFGHLPLNGKLKYQRDASRPDLASVERWFGHWLKGEKTGIQEEPAVRYYLMGDPFDESAPGNRWLTSAKWPPSDQKITLWLAKHGQIESTCPSTIGKESYRYDPKDPCPTVGGNNLFLSRGPMDQSKLRSRKDILRFQTDPLTKPLLVAGRVQVPLRVSTDVPDTDFMVKLIDVFADGYEALILDAPMRLRFREGFEKPLKAEKDKEYDITVNLGSTAMAFAPGHRLAIHIQSSNAPRFEPHTNTWEPVATYDEAIVATNVVHLGGEKGSRVILPVIGEEVLSADR